MMAGALEALLILLAVLFVVRQVELLRQNVRDEHDAWASAAWRRDANMHHDAHYVGRHRPT